jgi:hypothetical protein
VLAGGGDVARGASIAAPGDPDDPLALLVAHTPSQLFALSGDECVE